MAEKIGSLEFDIIGIDNISEVVEASKARIQGLVDATKTGSETMDSAANKIKTEFKTAFKQVDQVIDTNIAKIKELEAQQSKMKSSAGKAFQSGKDDEYIRITQRESAIASEIATRKKLVSEASKSNTELASLEEKVAAKVKVTSDATGQYRTQIRAAKEEMARMEAQGLRNSAAYQELQEKAGKLTDKWKDATAQANIMANDQRGFQGVITGLSGISGAMSAAAGAYGLFAGENENLQKIMTKVQSLMAITIGLQQISQTVNKDSAFMLVTVNGLKKWWNEITGKSVVVETAEAVATKAATAAKKGQTTEILKGTAATAGNTAATATGTVATKGLAGGFKMVGAAIKSIPGIGWLIIAVTAVVGAFALLTKKTREARKEQLEFNKKVAESVVEPVTQFNKLSLQFKSLGNDMKAKEKFVKDNAKAFEELGVSVNSVADAENLLIKNTQAFIKSQIAKAKATIYMQQAQEKMKEAMELRSKEELSEQTKDLAEGSAFEYTIGGKLYQGVVAGINATKDLINKQRLKRAGELDKEIQVLYKKAISSESDAAKELEKVGINTAEKYAEGSLKALQEALSLKNEMFEKTGSDAERRKLKKEIDAIQKQIDKIDIRRKEKDDDPFLEQLQKQKIVYDQIEKDLKSTDENVVQSAKDKYDKLKNQGETYLKYLEGERTKILASDKQLNATQKKNVETLNKEISELTQGKGSVIGDYSYSLQKEKIIQKYDKDIADIKNRVGTVDIETGITISEKDVEEAIKHLKSKKNKELEDLMNSFYPKTDFQSLLNEYADFEQQRNAIAKKYQDIRDKMHEQNASDIKAGIPVTFKDANFKSVDSKEMEDIAAVNKKELDVLISQSSKMMDIFTRIQALSKTTAREAIRNAKAISDYITSNGTTLLPEGIDKEMVDKLKESPEELQIFYDRLSAMQEEYIEQSKNPFDEIIYGIGNLKLSYELLTKAESETNKETAKTLRLQANIAKEKGLQTIYNYANKAANGLQMMVQAMREYGEASGNSQIIAQAEALGALADNLSAAAGGAASGGWIGAIVGGASNLLSQFVAALSNGKRQAILLENALNDVAEAAKKANYEMLMSGETRENYFGEDSYGKFLDAMEAEKEARKLFNDAVANYSEETLYGSEKNDWWNGLAISLFTGTTYATKLAAGGISNSFKEYQEAIQNGYKGLETMSIKTKDASGFAELFGAKDEYTSLKDLFPKLFNADGTINTSELEKIKATDLWDENFTDEQKQDLEGIAEAQDMVNKAIAVQKEYLSGLFSSLGNEISDAMWTAAKEGTNATKAIGEALDKMIENFAKQMIYSKVLQPYFDQMEETINYKLDKGESMESIMGWMATRIQEDMGWYEEEYKRVFDAFGKKFGGKESSLATLSGAIKGASQESIDLLAGQTNAVRLNQVEALSLSRSQLFRLVSIDSGVQQIVQIMNANKVNNQIQTDPLRAKGVTTL